MRACERRAQFDADRSFKSWWFAILRHHCLDELRRHKRAPNPVGLADIHLATAPEENVLDRLALEAALTRLTDIHREVLSLKYFAELSYDELAITLDIPKGTVMSRLHLVRRALAGIMNAEKQP